MCSTARTSHHSTPVCTIDLQLSLLSESTHSPICAGHANGADRSLTTFACAALDLNLVVGEHPAVQPRSYAQGSIPSSTPTTQSRAIGRRSRKPASARLDSAPPCRRRLPLPHCRLVLATGKGEFEAFDLDPKPHAAVFTMPFSASSATQQAVSSGVAVINDATPTR